MEQTTHPTEGPELYGLQFIRHTGMLVLWHQSSRTYQGTYEQCMAEYASAQRHNLIFGWWSITSIIFGNWFALIQNFRRANQLKKIACKA